MRTIALMKFDVLFMKKLKLNILSLKLFSNHKPHNMLVALTLSLLLIKLYTCGAAIQLF